MFDGRLTKAVWKRFVSDGVIDSTRINKRIVESWYLCRNKGVDPYQGEGSHILSSQQLMNRKEKNTLLLELALPYLKNLYPKLKATHALLLLIDPEGYVIRTIGHEKAMEQAKQINFIEGVRWTENQVGTNSIGTALRIDEPIKIIGTEHYAKASHSWVCSASPIHDDDGEIVGILDVSIPIDKSVKDDDVLASLVATAYKIERQWKIRMDEEEVTLLKYATEQPSTNKLTLVCNRKGQIIKANPAFRQAYQNWSHTTLEQIMAEGFQSEKQIPIYSQSQIIGYKMDLYREKRKMQRSGNRYDNLNFKGVKGASAIFESVLQYTEKASKTDASIHITGATGTGKEVLAHTIHSNSDRQNGPFIAVNCGAIPESLIESELFGYAPGAFTGAKRQGYKGKIEQANHGTLFLDEIGEISPTMQVALLRILEEKSLTPIGGMNPIPIDIRLVTATHQNLAELVKTGQFRADLYYRIMVFPIQLPSLAQRPEDIPYFIEYFCKQHDWHVSWDASMMKPFQNYHWPGNIRELFNILERLRILYGDQLPQIDEIEGVIPSTDLSSNVLEPTTLSYREQLELKKIKHKLEETNGNANEAAKQLDIPRSTFYRKLKKYHL
ncbi:sigma-54-dependent Fis family transcriptional regulator [Tuberibacillus sp. Marseille-P3662]|uniref:sigma-54-dependent Fis family transcriptional regulator n=1 Tax=Tuberibacillus sp. Marseille-P3662 TaxID=1965358 RepID=UPI000A1CBF8F|nr:sigma-54-dependent Fis family transcriptional regulator [Tuberibacillus sp. Marseille-P3662]